MITHVLGFPRIGRKREYKRMLEAYWSRKIDVDELHRRAKSIRIENWQIQKRAGMTYVSCGDFSFYDHVLDTSMMLGAIPKRFGTYDAANETQQYFAMARGNEKKNVAAMEMTKWFNTNYHFIVPEIERGFSAKFCASRLIGEVELAISNGFKPKPVILGPLTWLSLAKGEAGVNVWDNLDEVVSVYSEVLKKLAEKCDWIQLDEPILCTEMCETASTDFLEVYSRIKKAAMPAKILLSTYFEKVDDNISLLLGSGCQGIHLDMVAGKWNIADLLSRFPKSTFLSAGLVDGRNIWRTNLDEALQILKQIERSIGRERLMICSSCSLLHSPVDLATEMKLDDELKSWLAFAVQKTNEISLLSDVLIGRERNEQRKECRDALWARQQSRRTHNEMVRDRTMKMDESLVTRDNPYSIRRRAQEKVRKQELLPTTTIGSFPQTSDIRKARRLYKKGMISEDTYIFAMRAEIARVINEQEEIGLDVLVHGEPERNDMVEYFGEQMEGFCFTQNGWVQSYGSRCVKPPIIYGDISRPIPMTIDWIQYANSLTEKPVKGMLTGPVTIMCWSFVRDDLARKQVCRQISFAVRDEVRDLEQSGIDIIQIDEAALSEGIPVKQRDRDAYLIWAAECFRIATSVVKDETQIHTHMCYSEFNHIMPAVAQMDADVISIESSRSKMELLEAFGAYEYPNEIGPGVYDIHSPRIPTVDEMESLLRAALAIIPKERLWVNPDCGLKTRRWKEVKLALENMVEAARILREEIDVHDTIR